MAERVGFEPTVKLLTPHTISNRAPSASRASLHSTFFVYFNSSDYIACFSIIVVYKKFCELTEILSLKRKHTMH